MDYKGFSKAFGMGFYGLWAFNYREAGCVFCLPS